MFFVAKLGHCTIRDFVSICYKTLKLSIKNWKKRKKKVLLDRLQFYTRIRLNIIKTAILNDGETPVQNGEKP